MLTLLVYLITVVILGMIVLIRGQDKHLERNKTVNGLLLSGFIVLGLQALFYLIFAVGEMLGGDMSGAGHLVPVLTLVLLGLFVWRRPLEGGVLMLLAGSFMMIFFGMDALMITWPMPAAGLLFTIGAILGHRMTTHGPGHNI